MACEHCAKPGDKTKDFLVAVGPNGKVAWWARKDCPEHGIKYVGDTKPHPAPVEIEPEPVVARKRRRF